ncbi:MAG: glycosyltransferase [Ignavibacteriales bacterium]|nr:glycosyltransferase [Ignavibacteriales bacterium]
MKKLFFISYNFPPFSSGGVIRAHSFVKYLPKNGIIPFVLSASLDDVPEGRKDNSFLPQYDPSVQIFRTKGQHFFEKFIFNPYAFRPGLTNKGSLKGKLLKIVKKMIFPDPEIYWLLPAMVLGNRIIKKYKCSIIFVTAPPHSTMIAAYLLSVFHRIPLIIDLRDDWVGNPFYTRTVVGKLVAELLEKVIVRRAQSVITVTKISYDLLVQRHNKYQKKIELIPNGYDPEYIKPVQPRRRKNIVFHYGGTLTRNRDPRTFLRAASEYCAEHKLNSDDISFEFVGNVVDPEFLPSLQSSELFRIIPNMEYVTYQRHISENVDIILIFQSKTDGGETAIPGKLYDAIIRQKPILSITEGGAVDDFLKTYPTAATTSITDIQEIKNSIDLVIGYCGTKGQMDTLPSKEFSRIEQTKRLAHLVMMNPQTRKL